MASSFLEMALGTRLSTSSTFQTHFMPYKLFPVTRHSGEMSPRAQNQSRHFRAEGISGYHNFSLRKQLGVISVAAIQNPYCLFSFCRTRTVKTSELCHFEDSSQRAYFIIDQSLLAKDYVSSQQ